MKIMYTFVVVLVILNSCRKAGTPTVESPKWSNDRIKTFFRDSILLDGYGGMDSDKWLGTKDSLRTYRIFARNILKDVKAKNIMDPYVMAFDEEFIDTTKIDSSRRWFRFYVKPSFRIPYCLTLEQKGEYSVLKLKMTGFYISDYLNFSDTQYTYPSFYDTISNDLHKIDFWNIKPDTTDAVHLDGETWVFEAMENGKYNIVNRWTPLNYGDEITRKLARICVSIRDKSIYDEVLPLRTGFTK